MSHPARALYFPVGEMAETESITGTAYKPLYIGASNRFDQSPRNKCSGNEIFPIESSIEEDSTKSPPRARRYCRSGTRLNRWEFLHSLIYRLAHRTARRYPSKSGWHMPPARSLDSVHPHPGQAARFTLDRASICAAGIAERFPKATRVSQARSYRREGQCHRH
jgi:hypothetical protein